MMNGLYQRGEIITDEGVFTKYDGFRPKCLFYSSTQGGSTHGDIAAQYALRVSCNYFFYELADRCTWQMLDATAQGFGFGEPTGIELTEIVGTRSNPDSKKANHAGADAVWGAGDRVLTGIGQAENRITPLQLCVYACTLANQGTRYKATFLNRVASADYRTLIYENEPKILSQMDITNDIYLTYLEGMREVASENGGTASNYFGGVKDPGGRNYPVAVCAKTGTAQHSSGGSDHGAFICFAPMEDPEIAIALFGEKVGHGSSLAGVADKIIESYYEMVRASETFTYENRLG